MADEPRPPVAIRSMRPYATEEEFLAEERDTLSRTAVTLIGAPPRPRGVVIRFEITLSDGVAIVRGEGRVLSYQAADERGPSALTLRFTRLDAKSKALVDRAADLHDAASSSATPTEGTPLPTDAPPAPPSDDDPLASTSMGFTMPSTLEEPPPPSDAPVSLAISSGSLPLGEVEEIGQEAASDTDPARREGLLDRLRTRAKALTPSQIATILAPRSGTT